MERDPPSGGCSLGLVGEPRLAGHQCHYPFPTPIPKHGAAARSDHGRHKASGPRKRAASPWLPQPGHFLWSNVSSKILGPLITMQPHLMINSQGCFQRCRVQLLLFSLGEPIWCSRFHLTAGVGGLTAGDTVSKMGMVGGPRGCGVLASLEEDAIQPFVPSPAHDQAHLKIKCRPAFTASTGSRDTSH